MCHENEMGAAKEQHPYIICRLDKQRRWNSGGTVTRPLFIRYQRGACVNMRPKWGNSGNGKHYIPHNYIIPRLDDVVNHHSPATSSVPQELSCVQSVWSGLTQ